MNNSRKQMVISATVLLAAVGVVGGFALAGDAPEQAGPQEHDHAAMTAGSAAAKTVSLDAESARRIGVSYARAETGTLTRTVRAIGSITYDETRLVNVNLKIEGWVEKLHVNFTGAPITRGQPLMAVYSPMLVAAQEELILAARLLRDAPAGVAQDNARDLLAAARRRLTYWDIAVEDIDRIERTGTTQKTLTIRAPASGLVVEKSVFQGTRIMPGMDLYRIADLSTVWIEGEVYEKDLGLVGIGREVTITVEAYPGETFAGRITYVYPAVAAETRTGRVRIEVRNPALKFKPGMYANIAFEVPVHLNGLHVPRSAVLSTGTRSLVFVQHVDGSLVPHEVTIGQAAGDHVEILAGLTEGQIVVASASFLVDAESNLGAAIREMKSDAPATTDAAGPAASTQHSGH